MFAAASPAVWALALALAGDAAWGDPANTYHPVAWLGRFAAHGKRQLFRSHDSPLSQLLAGSALTAACVAVSIGLPMSLVHLLPLGLGFVAGAAMLKCTFALKALGAAGERMRAALHVQDLPAARQALGHLCSRSGDTLTAEELAGATVESLAENLSDSFVAPLFYYCLLGLPGALVYRAVNTLDAMFGYRGRYEWFGKSPARIDDVLNFVPARLTALLLLIAGAVQGRSVARGVRVWRRDARKTASPNAGHPMAAVAGLLGVRLDKRDMYSLGDADSALGPETIGQAWNLVRLAAWIAAALALVWLTLGGS